MAKAPSEKHLEDYICTHNRFLSVGYWDEETYPDVWERIHCVWKILKRQPVFPSGIPDLVAVLAGKWKPSIGIVELKKNDVDEDSVIQCLRYMYDLRQILHFSLLECGLHIPSDFINRIPITGLIIGHSMPNDKLQIICEAANIQVLLYNWTSSEVNFFLPKDELVWNTDLHHWEKKNRKWSYQEGIYRDFSKGTLGDSFNELLMGYLEELEWLI